MPAPTPLALKEPKRYPEEHGDCTGTRTKWRQIIPKTGMQVHRHSELPTMEPAAVPDSLNGRPN